MNFKQTIPFIIFLFLVSSVYAVPPATYRFDSSTYRPGTSGVITLEIYNNEGNDERNFEVCFTKTQYINPTHCGSISYLTSGQRANATINFDVLNEAPTPHQYPISLYYNYQYDTILGWMSDTGTATIYVSVSGISIKDEANQKITQLPSTISSAESAIRDLQGAITNAQSSITSAQSVGASLSTANNYISNANSFLSTAQNQLSSANTYYSTANSYFSQNSYYLSLDAANSAITYAQNAKSNADSGYTYALNAKTSADTARENAISENQAKLAQQQQAENSARQNQQASSNQNSSSTGTDYSGLFFLIILVLIGAAAYYIKNNVEIKRKK